MPPKEEPKADPAAKADAKAEAKPAAKTEEPKVDPAVRELAEKIYIQKCINHNVGFKPEQSVLQSFVFAKAFLAHVSE